VFEAISLVAEMAFLGITRVVLDLQLIRQLFEREISVIEKLFPVFLCQSWEEAIKLILQF
jgi:hypothetical protein